ncbi:MAG: hypothetical protein HDS80_06500 [Bacteroidales bacterium]|nr:hypothetical protein [Bacteroidales bacterium]MBD5209574.1 hypothetical protein [Bacteroidales bacterium]
MKKTLLFLGLGALLLTSCGGNKEAAEVDSLAIVTQNYEEATNFNDSLLLLMGDIYTGLDSINVQEGLLYNMGAGDNVNRREEIRQNLANIKARLNANRQLLETMQSKLNASDGKNAVLVKTINQLKERIEAQDQKIASLQSDLDNARGEIENLNTQVAEGQEQLKTETAAKEQAMAETVAAENEANKVFYAVGTNKELKKNGLLEKKFLGTTKVLKGDFNTSYFTQADKRKLNVINTNSKKVKIWSNVPANSYEIVDNANGTKTIKILNPSSFWSLTPYLIVQID